MSLELLVRIILVNSNAISSYDVMYYMIMGRMKLCYFISCLFDNCAISMCLLRGVFDRVKKYHILCYLRNEVICVGVTNNLQVTNLNSYTLVYLLLYT